MWARGVVVVVGVGLIGCRFDPAGVGLDREDAGPAPTDPVDAAAIDGAVGDGAPAADASPPRFCDPADPDLVACYEFEVAEHADQPFDQSQYHNHGRADGAGFRPGRAGAGMAVVAGPAASIRVPDSRSLDVDTAMTIELWVFPDALPASGQRAGLVDNERQYGLFLQSSGQVRCSVGGREMFALTVPAGRWTHLACTYDGDTLALYQDGVLGGSEPDSGNISGAGTDGLTLGQNSPDGDHLQGALDQLRIWRVARTAAQIESAYAGPR